MLFDLRSGRRRNFIRVIYGALAVLMGGGLILFGIGGEVSGGLLDGLGVGGEGSSGSVSFEDEIDAAEKKLQANPKDQAALFALATAHVDAGNTKLDVDPETGAPIPTSEAEEEFQLAADAWARYLEQKPSTPDPGTAAKMSQAYVVLVEAAGAAGELNEIEVNLQGAVDAQRIVATAMPTFGSLAALARYLYFNGDPAEADQVGKQAQANATSSQRSQLRALLTQSEKFGAMFQERLKKAQKAGAAAPGENPLESPGGGLSGGGLSLGGP